MTQNKINIKEKQINIIENTKDIDRAFELLSNDHTYSDLIKFLQDKNPEIKVFGLLKLTEIKNPDDAFILMSCMQNPDSRVRDLSAALILKFFETNCCVEFFDNKEFTQLLLDSVKDINPNVCRNVISLLKFQKDKNFILEHLCQKALETVILIKSQKNSNSHDHQKDMFKAYWSLSAIESILATDKDYTKSKIPSIFEIIEQSFDYPEYTIREKTAAIIAQLCGKKENCAESNQKLQQIKQILSNDENFYVKFALNQKT